MQLKIMFILRALTLLSLFIVSSQGEANFLDRTDLTESEVIKTARSIPGQTLESLNGVQRLMLEKKEFGGLEMAVLERLLVNGPWKEQSASEIVHPIFFESDSNKYAQNLYRVERVLKGLSQYQLLSTQSRSVSSSNEMTSGFIEFLKNERELDLATMSYKPAVVVLDAANQLIPEFFKNTAMPSMGGGGFKMISNNGDGSKQNIEQEINSLFMGEVVNKLLWDTLPIILHGPSMMDNSHGSFFPPSSTSGSTQPIAPLGNDASNRFFDGASDLEGIRVFKSEPMINPENQAFFNYLFDKNLEIVSKAMGLSEEFGTKISLTFEPKARKLILEKIFHSENLLIDYGRSYLKFVLSQFVFLGKQISITSEEEDSKPRQVRVSLENEDLSDATAAFEIATREGDRSRSDLVPFRYALDENFGLEIIRNTDLFKKLSFRHYDAPAPIEPSLEEKRDALMAARKSIRVAMDIDDTPEKLLEKFVGQESITSDIYNFFQDFKNAPSEPQGRLLWIHGPPGSGKTSRVKEAAAANNLRFIHIDVSTNLKNPDSLAKRLASVRLYNEHKIVVYLDDPNTCFQEAATMDRELFKKCKRFMEVFARFLLEKTVSYQEYSSIETKSVAGKDIAVVITVNPEDKGMPRQGTIPKPFRMNYDEYLETYAKLYGKSSWIFNFIRTHYDNHVLQRLESRTLKAPIFIPALPQADAQKLLYKVLNQAWTDAKSSLENRESVPDIGIEPVFDKTFHQYLEDLFVAPDLTPRVTVASVPPIIQKAFDSALKRIPDTYNPLRLVFSYKPGTIQLNYQLEDQQNGDWTYLGETISVPDQSQLVDISVAKEQLTVHREIAGKKAAAMAIGLALVGQRFEKAFAIDRSLDVNAHLSFGSNESEQNYVDALGGDNSVVVQLRNRIMENGDSIRLRLEGVDLEETVGQSGGKSNNILASILSTTSETEEEFFFPKYDSVSHYFANLIETEHFEAFEAISRKIALDGFITESEVAKQLGIEEVYKGSNKFDPLLYGNLEHKLFRYLPKRIARLKSHQYFPTDDDQESAESMASDSWELSQTPLGDISTFTNLAMMMRIVAGP